MLEFKKVNNPCFSGPCQNNAICDIITSTGGYYCQCQPGFTGSNCAFSNKPNNLPHPILKAYALIFPFF